MRLDDGVAQIRRSRTVAATPEAVWGVLADFGALSSWAKNVDHSCLLEHGEAGAGIGTSRRVQVGRNTIVERITELNEPTTLGYDVEGLPRLAGRVNNTWTVAPAGPASAAVTLTTTVGIGTNPVARLAERTLCRFLAKESDALLAGLTARMEGSR